MLRNFSIKVDEYLLFNISESTPKSLFPQNYPVHKACEWGKNRKNRVFGGGPYFIQQITFETKILIQN